MIKEEVLIAIKEIQCRYSLPALEINFTDRDYACIQYEKLVLHLANKLEEKDKEIERLNNIINDLLNRQNEALKYISNFLSMDNRYKHGNGNDELELVRRILNKHNEELKGEDKE